MQKYSWECCIPGVYFGSTFALKYSHLTYGIVTFSWDENIFPCKNTKLPILSPTTAHHWLPSTAVEPPPTQPVAILCCRTPAARRWTAFELPLDRHPLMLDHHHPSLDHHRPPPDHRPLPPATGPSPSTRNIFGNVQNISENSIRLSNALKNTCLKKLFSGVIFLEILFPKMKIQTSYQTLPKA